MLFGAVPCGERFRSNTLQQQQEPKTGQTQYAYGQAGEYIEPDLNAYERAGLIEQPQSAQPDRRAGAEPAQRTQWPTQQEYPG